MSGLCALGAARVTALRSCAALAAGVTASTRSRSAGPAANTTARNADYSRDVEELYSDAKLQYAESQQDKPWWRAEQSRNEPGQQPKPCSETPKTPELQAHRHRSRRDAPGHHRGLRIERPTGQCRRQGRRVRRPGQRTGPRYPSRLPGNPGFGHGSPGAFRGCAGAHVRRRDAGSDRFSATTSSGFGWCSGVRLPANKSLAVSWPPSSTVQRKVAKATTAPRRRPR